MKRVLFLLLMALALNSNATTFDDIYQFKSLAKFAKSELGLKMRIPQGFYVMRLNYVDFMAPSSGGFYDSWSGVAFSEDKNALIVYSNIALIAAAAHPSEWHNRGLTGLIDIPHKIAKGTGQNADIKVITDSRLCGKADSVIIYEQQISSVNRFDFCMQIHVYANKRGYVPIIFKLLLTKQGLAKKEKYIRLALNSIKFGNRTDYVEKRKKDSMYFPLKRYLTEHNLLRYFPIGPCDVCAWHQTVHE